MMMTSEKEFQEVIERIQVSPSIKETIERVSKEMNADEELWSRYYNLEEEQAKINRTIIIEERERAMKEGLEQGAIQREQAIAKEMIKDGVSLEQISKYTNLSLEELENLKISEN